MSNRSTLKHRAPLACMVAAWLVALAATALADGKVFRRAVVVDPASMPSQRALVVLATGAGGNGRETLVVQPAVAGGGEDLAWVVPVPARPEVSEAGRNVFGSLEWRIAPVLVRPENDFFARFVAWIALVGLSLVTLFRPRCSVMLALLVVLPVFAMIATPNLIQARKGDGGPPLGVTIVESKRVGVFDVTVLTGREGTGVLRWLKEGGYAVDEGDLPVIERYVAQGWFFVASKIARGAGAQAGPSPSVPPPLRIDFPIARGEGVYPLALTAGMRKEIDLELFVVASGRVDHALLETRRSMAPSRFDEVKERPSLKGVVWPDTPWVTKLRGRLGPEQMREDLRLVAGERVGLDDRIYDPAFAPVVLFALVVGGIVLVCTWTLGWRGEKKRGPLGRLAVTALVLSWPLLHHELLAAFRGGQLEHGAGASPSAAIGALKTITTSQAIFREGDKDGDGKLDYAPSLADLAKYELVDKVLGSGTKQGYLFQVHRSATTPGFLWWATADPITPGHPSYFVDQTGEIRATVVLEKGGHAEADDELLYRRR